MSLTTTPLEQLRESLCQKRRDLPRGILAAEWDEVPKEIQRQVEASILNEQWPLLIYGQQGRGKTCLMALLYSCYKQPEGAKPPVWFRLSEFMRHVTICRTSGNGHSGVVLQNGSRHNISEIRLWARIEDAGILFLDDIGIRSPSDAQFEMFFEMLEMRNGKRTVLTSNLGPKELAELYDARIASRLVAGGLIQYHGVDRRQQAPPQLRVVSARNA